MDFFKKVIRIILTLIGVLFVTCGLSFIFDSLLVMIGYILAGSVFFYRFRKLIIDKNISLPKRIIIYVLIFLVGFFLVSGGMANMPEYNSETTTDLEVQDTLEENEEEVIKCDIDDLFSNIDNYINKKVVVTGYAPWEAAYIESDVLTNAIYSKDWKNELFIQGIEESLAGRKKVSIEGILYKENDLICIKAEKYTVLEENNINEEVNQDDNEATNQNNNEQTSYNTSLMYAIVKDAWDYAEQNNIDIHTFSERSKLLKMFDISILEAPIENIVFLEEQSNFSIFDKKGKVYKQTIDTTKIIYYGSLNKDNMPDGWGILFEYDTYYDQYLLKYMGQFKDGMYNGYGIEPVIINVQGMDMSSLKLLEESSNVVASYDFNEGIFKDGLKNGKVNEYSRVGNIEDKLYCIDVSEFEKDVLNGYLKSYYLNYIYYDGEIKNGDYHGKGKLYYMGTEQIKYEGEFKNDEYNGKGTLYDENGNIKYKGKFKNGDIE